MPIQAASASMSMPEMILFTRNFEFLKYSVILSLCIAFYSLGFFKFREFFYDHPFAN
jgi:hypothetical protein